MSNIYITIGGDLVPTWTNTELFSSGDAAALFGDKLTELFKRSNLVIANLECPLINEGKAIKKCGPNMKADESCINVIKDTRNMIIGLANNHILDYGAEGLLRTINLLDKNSIGRFGAGDNLSEAKRPYIYMNNGKKIGIYACAEHEFSIAEDQKPGANPYDPLNSFDDVRELKKQCQYVIVLYHGGKEHYRYPSPLLQKICRKFSDCGADLVICQHSHCIGCYEKYKESTIVYGQGNLLFNALDNEMWHEGLLIEVIMDENTEVRYVPIVQSYKGIRMAEGEEGERILNAFYKRSEQILDKSFVKDNWLKYCLDNQYNYLPHISGLPSILNRIDAKLNHIILKKYTNINKLARLYDYTVCETHNDLIKTFLDEAVKNYKAED